jgi:hypothetical protein
VIDGFLVSLNALRLPGVGQRDDRDAFADAQADRAGHIVS